VRRRTHPIAHRSISSAPIALGTTNGVRSNHTAVDSSQSGATLTVRECPTSFTDSFKDLCSEPTHITVDIQFERDVSTAVVTAAFYSGTKTCGVAYSGPSPFAAGSRASFELRGAIELSDESVQLHCRLPAETTRMVIQLWERSRPATPLLTQDFAHSYTFAAP